MNSLFKLLYVVIVPVVIILFYDDVVVSNWATWSAHYPQLETIPRWTVLAVASILYAGNVWMFVGADWLHGRRQEREITRQRASKTIQNQGKVLQFPRDRT
jgi:hypothetical protein